MPVVGGGVVRRDLIRKVPGIVFGAVRADILNDMVDGLDVGHIVDGVAQQQGGRLGHIVMLIPHRFRAEQTRQVAAHGISHDGVLLRLDAKLRSVFLNVLHGPADVLQRSVIGSIRPDAISQNKGGIAQLMQLPGRAGPLLQLGALIGTAASQDQRKLGIFGLGRKIEQAGVVFGAVRRLFRIRVERVSDLNAIVVVFNDQIQPLGTAFGHILVGVAFHSGHLPQGLTRRAVLILRVGVEAGVLDARVVAHFLHGGLGRDVGLSLFHYGTGGQGQQCQQTQHHRDDSFCLFHVPFLSPGTALIAFSRTEGYNMRPHRRHRLVFVLLYHTRRYCQNKSVRKIHAL